MKNINKIFYLILMMLFIFACDKEDSNKKRDTLNVALAYKPRSFDPQKNTDSATLAVTKQVYNNLFTLSQEGIVENELIENYKILKNNSIELKLKEGVFFHDGSELTAIDVKNSLERNKVIPVSSVLVSAIENIKVLDKYRLLIVQNNAPSILLHNLTHSSTAIVKDIKKSGINLVGTGAYKIKDWSVPEKVVLEKFDKFYGGKPKIDKIIFVTVPELSNRLIGLETGELDIVYDISPTDISTIKKNNKLEFINQPSLGTDFISINTRKIKDSRIREAIEYSINKKAIIDSVYDGYSSIPNSILTKAVFGYNPNLKSREYNLQKAKNLMKEAKVKSLDLNLWIYAEPTREQMAQIVQDNLKEIGVNVQIKTAEVPTFLQLTGQGEHDMLIGLWYISTGDADYGYFPLLHSKSAGSVGNRSFYSNSSVDRYLEEAKVANSENKRIENYTKAQMIISKDVPIIPISSKNYTIGLRKDVKGFIFNPNGNHILYKAYFE